MNEAAETLFEMNADEQIRKMCRNREEYYHDLRNYERAIAKCNNTITEQENTITEQGNTIADQASQIQQLLADFIEIKVRMKAEKRSIVQSFKNTLPIWEKVLPPLSIVP